MGSADKMRRRRLRFDDVSGVDAQNIIAVIESKASDSAAVSESGSGGKGEPNQIKTVGTERSKRETDYG